MFIVYKKKDQFVIPILYNIIAQKANIPENFQWIETILYILKSRMKIEHGYGNLK